MGTEKEGKKHIMLLSQNSGLRWSGLCSNHESQRWQPLEPHKVGNGLNSSFWPPIQINHFVSSDKMSVIWRQPCLVLPFIILHYANVELNKQTRQKKESENNFPSWNNGSSLQICNQTLPQIHGVNIFHVISVGIKRYTSDCGEQGPRNCFLRRLHV